MVLESKSAGEEAGKLSLTKLLALGGRESYLLFYKIAALLLMLNLILLGVQWVTAVITLPATRKFFIESAVMIGILLTVQLSFCLLARRTIVLMDEEEEKEDV